MSGTSRSRLWWWSWRRLTERSTLIFGQGSGATGGQEFSGIAGARAVVDEARDLARRATLLADAPPSSGPAGHLLPPAGEGKIGTVRILAFGAAHMMCSYRVYRQHEAPCSCTGGHGTVPYEQNTQQSPGLGLSNSPHVLQTYKKMQASVGMVSAAWCPQCGHVSVDCRVSATGVVIEVSTITELVRRGTLSSAFPRHCRRAGSQLDSRHPWRSPFGPAAAVRARSGARSRWDDDFVQWFLRSTAASAGRTRRFGSRRLS